MTRRRHTIYAALALVLALVLTGLGGCGVTGSGGGHSVEKQTFPIYLPEQAEKEEKDAATAVDSTEGDDDLNLDLYFLDGVDDLPYFSVADCAAIINTRFPVTCKTEGDVTVIERTDTGYTATFDIAKDTITFYDFDEFFRLPGAQVLVSSVDSSLPETKENQYLLPTGATYDRNGKEVVFELAPYDINLISYDGACLAPLQTLNDAVLAVMGTSFFFDGESVALGTDAQQTRVMTAEDKGEAKTLSEELAAYNYHELCFLLDSFYGLKDTHDIVSFDAFFDEVGLKKHLSSTDPKVFENALYDFIALHLDDIHSSYICPSPYAGANFEADGEANNVRGFSRLMNDTEEDRYKAVRKTFFPDGCPPYQEVGDTAFITFDSFDVTTENYYGELDETTSNINTDTVLLMREAHARITSEGSPIKNVVIDLSCNTGGAAPAAVVTMGMCLGEAPFALRNTLSSGMSIGMFRVDVNLDHQFDEKDGIGDRKVYCLTSPVSFSCGNLVPAAFKSSGRVTILGRPSAGGSCVVRPSSTAIGSLIKLSGITQCSFPKNGAFYNIDEGIEPDIMLSSPESYYDREKLVAYLDSLL